MNRLLTAVLALATAVLFSNAALADDTPPATDDATQMLVTGRRLDAARSQLLPETGSTIYRFSQSDLDTLPLGDDTPLNQVILQAPGVVADSYGQLHVRGDHANLQYRIDGIVIPEPMTGFGQALSTRLAEQINVLTGALPAEYGYRTAGVIDIHTHGAGYRMGGDLSLIVGRDHLAEISVDQAGAIGDWRYFVSGSYLHDALGIENPTASRHALHDDSQQASSFGYISRLLGDSMRISFLFGTSNNDFQIPDVPAQLPAYPLGDHLPPDSSVLNAHQNEQNQFQALSWQASPTDRIDYQLSLLHRITDVHYYPDPIGDLVFNGVAATIVRRLETIGLQGDVSYRLGEQHTLHAGLFVEREHFATRSESAVFRTDDDGNPITDAPIVINDGSLLRGGTQGIYLQDEWRLQPTLTLNGGVRFDQTTTVTDERQLSPRLGLVYDFSPGTRMHFGYARYFTPPPTEIIGSTSLAKFQDTSNQQPSDANTAVKAERSNYFDTGLTTQLSAGLSVGIDAYYRVVKNLQDEGQFGSALIYSAFNYAEGRVRGIELTTFYKQSGWAAYANLARSQAMGREVITGQYNFSPDELSYIAHNWIHLDHDQKLAGSAGLSYRWHTLTTACDLLYGSGLRSGFANTDHLPAYTEFNLSVRQGVDNAMLGHFTWRLALINLFDKSYALRDGSGVGVGAPQYGARRGLFAGIDKPF